MLSKKYISSCRPELNELKNKNRFWPSHAISKFYFNYFKASCFITRYKMDTQRKGILKAMT